MDEVMWTSSCEHHILLLLVSFLKNATVDVNIAPK